MSYDSDKRDAAEIFARWGNEKAVMSKEDFAYVNDLIIRYFDNRTMVFEDLINNALKRDEGITSPWSSGCDRGLALLEELSNAVSSKVPNGLREMDLGDYYDGEKAAWQSCKSSVVPGIAEGIVSIGKSDLEVFKQLEEDLKKAKDDSKVFDSLLKTNLGNNQDSARKVAAETVGIGVSLTTAGLDKVVKVLMPLGTKAAKDFIEGSKDLKGIGEKKKAGKDILQRNYDKVNAAKDKIGEGAVQDILGNAENAANGWKGAARGKYNARDWEAFANACREPLRDKAARTTERAKSLYYSMQPMYYEAIKGEFMTLFADASTYDNFFGRFNDETQKMFEELTRENEAIIRLNESDPQKTAVATMRQLVAELTEAVKTFKDVFREMNERMRN